MQRVSLPTSNPGVLIATVINPEVESSVVCIYSENHTNFISFERLSEPLVLS